MDNKLFLVSFGNSSEYVATREELDNARRAIDEYIKANYQGTNIDYKYFKAPEVRELHPDEIDWYASYPHLDHKALDKIKEVVNTGVEVMESEKELNNNHMNY